MLLRTITIKNASYYKCKLFYTKEHYTKTGMFTREELDKIDISKNRFIREIDGIEYYIADILIIKSN